MISDFDYYLPPSSIADKPASPRDHCRLLGLNRRNSAVSHYRFSDLPSLLTPDDVLVFNDTKVFPARLFGHKQTGGKIEVLLLKALSDGCWQAISSPRPPINSQIVFSRGLSGQIVAADSQTGEVRINFNVGGDNFLKFLFKIGRTPLPPYIHSSGSESTLRRQYQTIYAQTIGSAAAPTAGLHFTRRLIRKITGQKIATARITLHVGLGTFQPVRQGNLKTGKLHTEHYFIDPTSAAVLTGFRRRGKRIIAVGTTTARCLESAFTDGSIEPGAGTTDIFIRPGYKFNFVDGLITNFHLPNSSLLMLVSAFVSSPNTPYQFLNFLSSPIGLAYKQAIARSYRFFSFGDACLIL